MLTDYRCPHCAESCPNPVDEGWGPVWDLSLPETMFHRAFLGNELWPGHPMRHVRRLWTDEEC